MLSYNMRNTIINYVGKKKPLILDGAMGTELERKGLDCSLPLWSARALMESPGTVREIHASYVKAGADIITANTFRTNQRTFDRARVPASARDLTMLAVKLVREAIEEAGGERNIWCAGSVAPLEDCYSPHLVPGETELKWEHSNHIRNLAEAGVDILLIETMNSLREAHVALDCAFQYQLPVILSFVVKGDRILSGETIREAAELAEKFDPLSIGLNCSRPEELNLGLSLLMQATEVPVVAYPNIGVVDDDQRWHRKNLVTIKDYVYWARKWVEQNVSIIGGCCGTTPSYIKALQKTFRPITFKLS